MFTKEVKTKDDKMLDVSGTNLPFATKGSRIAYLLPHDSDPFIYLKRMGTVDHVRTARGKLGIRIKNDAGVPMEFMLDREIGRYMFGRSVLMTEEEADARIAEKLSYRDRIGQARWVRLAPADAKRNAFGGGWLPAVLSAAGWHVSGTDKPIREMLLAEVGPILEIPEGSNG
jgi:hypothetical protein